MKGKWAQGIKPRNFAWVITDRLAVCERPGGYGSNHRKVRRQEEIIWIREQGFTKVISLIPSPHNLHNYDDSAWPGCTDRSARRPGRAVPRRGAARSARLMAAGEKCSCTITSSATGCRASWRVPAVGGYRGRPTAVTVIERLLGRQLGPFGRELVAIAPGFPGRVPDAVELRGLRC